IVAFTLCLDPHMQSWLCKGGKNHQESLFPTFEEVTDSTVQTHLEVQCRQVTELQANQETELMQGDSRAQIRGLNSCAELLQGVIKQATSLEDALGQILDITCRTIGQPELFGTLLFWPMYDRAIAFTWSSRGGLQKEPYPEE